MYTIFANTVADDFEGNPAVCPEGYTDGQGKIEIKQSATNTLVLVAGFSALDTRKAARVIARYEEAAIQSQLTTDSVIVTGTSLTDIGVTP